MVKQTGLGWAACSLIKDPGGAATPTYDLLSPTTNLDIATPRAMQDSTGLDKYAIERLPLLSDATVNLSGIFDPTVAHVAFVQHNAQGGPDWSLTNTIAAQTLVIRGWMTDYQLARAQSGEFTTTVPFVLGDGTIPTWT